MSQQDELLGKRLDFSDADNQVWFVKQLKIAVVAMRQAATKVGILKTASRTLLETERVHEAHVLAQTTAPDTCEAESSDLLQIYILQPCCHSFIAQIPLVGVFVFEKSLLKKCCLVMFTATSLDLSETLAATEIDLHLPEEWSSEDEEGCKDG